MSLLLLSIVALGLGPLIVTFAGARSWVLALVDGFVIVTIGGIALIHILPEALLTCGPWAFAAAAAGLFGPMLLERKNHPHHDHVHGGDTAKHRPALVLALLGIAMHAFLDGSAFAEHVDEHGSAHAHGSELLGLAVVLHRMPEGLAIWWLVRPRLRSAGAAVGALALVAGATVMGSRFGDELVHGTGVVVFSFVQAVVAGSLLHVVIHHAPPSVAWSHHHHHARGASIADADPHLHRDVQVAPAVGAVLGLTLLVVVTESHPTAQRIAHEIGMGATFLTLALESAPALLVSYVASGLLHAFLPRSFVGWLAKGGPFTQSLRGVVVGPLLPVCSCGVLPLYRAMRERGAPRAAALTLLVAAPEIGLATMLLSWSLLGGQLALVRGAAAVVTAIAVGYGVTRVVRDDAEADAPPPIATLPPTGALRARIWAGLRYGLGDTVDHTSPWIMIGLALGAFAEPLLDADTVGRVSSHLEVVVFAALGLPMYLCASGATPLVAVLLHKGVSPGAAIAFLLTGPALNLTTFGVLDALHGRKLAAWFGVAMLVVPTLIGWAVNVALPRTQVEHLHDAARAPASAVEIVCLAALALLVAVSLVRHGPRHMVAQLVTGQAHSH
ncbi:MAG: permease [Labilithrix sp.]|nr:permease [Labilithrix sp.]MCW5812805.1 permease [Labilithrix sp.]